MNEVRKILKSVFGYSSFKANQKEVIKAILAGRDLFAAMPTGGGKSLCYQIPALLFDGLTVVVSPLIALMKDQVDAALSLGIPAAFLNSSQSQEEAAETYRRLYRGEMKLLYLSPERLAVDGFTERLAAFNVSLFAVDEAHCLSEWGHDFRPDYLALAQLRTAFPGVPIAAFTATATLRVQEDIIRLLRLDDPFILRASFNREELFYQVLPKTEVLSQIAQYIGAHPDQSGIVYRLSRKDTDKTADYLRKQGIRALPYHAGMDKDKRARNQERFNNDDVQVIVATTAFGMGIDKNNIRYVIHGDLPKSMEGYYQETGRAGRDGLESRCILFFGTADIARLNYFIRQIEDPAEQRRSRENLDRMARFASVNVCRRKQILEYFNETLEGNCGSCDVCTGTTNEIDAGTDARKLLSAIYRTREGFGAGHIIDIVRGADTEKIRKNGHAALKTYGVGRDKSKKWWMGIVTELIGQQMIFRDSDRFNVLRFTEEGRKLLFGKEPFFILDPGSKAEASVKAPSFERTAAGGASAPANTQLLTRLKQLRTRLAKEHHLPPYIIFSDKTLTQMAAALPETSSELLAISGVGEKKLAAYGSDFLAVIREHM